MAIYDDSQPITNILIEDLYDSLNPAILARLRSRLGESPDFWELATYSVLRDILSARTRSPAPSYHRALMDLIPIVMTGYVSAQALAIEVAKCCAGRLVKADGPACCKKITHCPRCAFARAMELTGFIQDIIVRTGYRAHMLTFSVEEPFEDVMHNEFEAMYLLLEEQCAMYKVKSGGKRIFAGGVWRKELAYDVTDIGDDVKLSVRPHVHMLVLAEEADLARHGLGARCQRRLQGLRAERWRISPGAPRSRYSLARHGCSFHSELIPPDRIHGALSYILKPQSFVGKADGAYALLCARHRMVHEAGMAPPTSAAMLNEIPRQAAEHFFCTFRTPCFASKRFGTFGCLHGLQGDSLDD